MVPPAQAARHRRGPRAASAPPARPRQQAQGAPALSGSEVVIRRAGPADHAAIVDLWERCALTRPWIDAASELELKVATDPDGLLVACLDDEVVGTVMVGFEGHRGWINYLAVDPDRRRSGIARRLMTAAEDRLRDLGAPKVNLQVRRTNADVVAFYESLGYVDDDVVSLGRRLD